MEIRIVSRSLQSEEIYDGLSFLCAEENISLEIRPASLQLRTSDSTFLVAILSSAGTVLGMFLRSVIEFVKKQEMRKVIVEVKGESKRIEIPADYPIEQVEALINMLTTMEVTRVVLD